MKTKSIFSVVPLPAKREYKARVTEEMKEIKVGQSYVCPDHETMHAYVQWMRYKGMGVVQVTENGKTRVGRIS